MPITSKDITEHKEWFNYDSLETLENHEYQELLGEGAFLYQEAHGFIAHRLSAQVIAKNKDQLDMLIEYLKSLRDLVPDGNKLD